MKVTNLQISSNLSILIFFIIINFTLKFIVVMLSFFHCSHHVTACSAQIHML